MKDPKRTLAREVAARLRFLKKVTDFAASISSERGKQLHYSQSSSHTHTVYALCNFGGFSFHVERGMTMFGGNAVKVWYNPNRQHGEVPAPHVSVLDISWQIDIEKCTHLYFDPGKEWQEKILEVIRNRKRISARIDRDATTSAKKAVANREKEEQQQKLTETAKQLQVH